MLISHSFLLFHCFIFINLILLPCHKKDTHCSVFISSLFPTANFHCFISLFHVLCGQWDFLKRMNRLFNAGQLHQLIKVFPPVLHLSCYFAFHFLHIDHTGLFIILQICPTNMCFSTSVCDAALALHSMFRLSSPIEILFFQQLPF